MEYYQELGVDLCFQGFQEVEMKDPLAKYQPPRGDIFLFFWDGELAGSGAVYDLGGNECELKRVFVRQAYRGHGIGRVICERLLEHAIEQGFAKAKLDTIDHMKAAQAIYRSLGFVETTAYYTNPLDGVVYMERDLTSDAEPGRVSQVKE